MARPPAGKTGSNTRPRATRRPTPPTGANGRAFAHIGDLTQDPRNARAHGPRNVGAIVSALQEVGAARSIVIDEVGRVLAGNATLEAAGEAGLTRLQVVDADGETIVAVRRSGLTEAQKVRLALFDNRAAELAVGWEAGMLAELQAEGVSFEGLWTEDELAALLAREAVTDGKTDPDDVPDVRSTDIVAGDLFELGKHRLLCGDSTNAEGVARLMGAEKAAIVFTDPPYGMGYDPAMCDSVRPKGEWCNTPKNYHKVIGDDAPFDPATIFTMFDRCREIFLWGADYYSDRIPRRDSGSWFVWDKRAGLEDVRWTTSEFELCWSKVRHQRQFARVRWHGLCGMEKDDTKSRVHPTQKPAELGRWFLDRFSVPDAITVDAYAGSGFTLIACEQLDRRCRAVEIEPGYCQVIIDRWEAFTGQKAQKVGEAVRA